MEGEEGVGGEGGLFFIDMCGERACMCVHCCDCWITDSMVEGKKRGKKRKDEDPNVCRVHRTT